MKALSLLNRLKAFEIALKHPDYDTDARDHDIMILESWCGETIERTKGGTHVHARKLGKPASKKAGHD